MVIILIFYPNLYKNMQGLSQIKYAISLVLIMISVADNQLWSRRADSVGKTFSF